MLSPNSRIVLTGFSRVNRNTEIEGANKSLLKIGRGGIYKVRSSSFCKGRSNFGIR